MNRVGRKCASADNGHQNDDPLYSPCSRRDIAAQRKGRSSFPPAEQTVDPHNHQICKKQIIDTLDCRFYTFFHLKHLIQLTKGQIRWNRAEMIEVDTGRKQQQR
ncbi:hypothetical protein D3C75_1006060 [compost metagenome]